MNIEKIFALKTAITGSTDKRTLSEDIPRGVLINFFKIYELFHKPSFTFTTLTKWLDGEVEIPDVLLMKIIEDQNCRLTRWSGQLA